MSGLFRKEVIENKKERLQGTVMLSVPTSYKALTFLLVSLFVVSIVFLSLSSFSKKEKVSGLLQSTSAEAKLKSLRRGVIAKILVTEGQEVEAGEPIVVLQTEDYGIGGIERNSGLIDNIENQKQKTQKQIDTLKAISELKASELDSSLTSLLQQKNALLSSIGIAQERIKINVNLKSQINKLSNQGYISELELNRQSDTILGLRQQLSNSEKELFSLNSKIDSANYERAQLPLNTEKEIQQLATFLSDLELQLLNAKQNKDSVIIAPIDGTVSGMLIKEGEFVQEGQSLFSVIPVQDDLEAIVYIPTKASGFISINDKVKLKYQAFPYEKFGAYEGRIHEISNNVILPDETNVPNIITEPSYRVKIKLSEQNVMAYGKPVKLRTGMKLDADVLIGSYSLFFWLFEPIISLKG